MPQQEPRKSSKLEATDATPNEATAAVVASVLSLHGLAFRVRVPAAAPSAAPAAASTAAWVEAATARADGSEQHLGVSESARDVSESARDARHSGKLMRLHGE